MISVENALNLVQTHSKTLAAVPVALELAHQHVLAKDAYAPIAMPPFRQAAMDGYALHGDQRDTYHIIGEVKAGDADHYQLHPGEAVRIFTGAKVPDSANTVVMQEQTSRTLNQITLQVPVHNHQNIREIGEQITKGTIALPKGTKLNAASIGFLAGLGIAEVWIYPSPKVGIVITGNELVAPGETLTAGKIYESNYLQLATALQQLNLKTITKYVVKDDYQSTKDQLKTALAMNDIVLVSGGISVGDYDYVGRALKALGTREVFFKIKQKPGKPLFFGMHHKTPVFALPGNPASSLTCFYIYAIPLLNKMMGISPEGLHYVKKKLLNAYSKKGDRAQFLKALVTKDKVSILEGQSSAMLRTYAIANALVYFSENNSGANQNELVTTILLPTI